MRPRKRPVNPEFYIGYADDNESIDDIMQKFSYLDEIQAKNKENDGLTSDQYEDLYRKTANFKPDAIVCEFTAYSSYEQEEDFQSDENLVKVKRLKRGRPRLERDPLELEQLQHRYHRVKPHTTDPDAPVFIKLPDQIPRSWAQIIQPLGNTVNSALAKCKLITADFSELDFSSLGSDFQVCYLDPPLVADNVIPLSGQLRISDFAELSISSLVKSGFLFIWVEKQFTAKLLKIVDHWGYRYIENIAWIKKNLDNSVCTEPSRFFNKSKTTCYVFRNDGDIKLRHQRNADVEFDFLKPGSDSVQEKPERVYEIIETLLPDAADGKMIQLWARPGLLNCSICGEKTTKYKEKRYCQNLCLNSQVAFKFFAYLQLFVNSKVLKILAFDDQITEIIGVKAEKYYELLLNMQKLDAIVNKSFNGQLAKVEVGPSKRDNELVLCNLEMIFSPGKSIMEILKIHPDGSIPESTDDEDITPLLIRPKKKLKFDPFQLEWDST